MGTVKKIVSERIERITQPPSPWSCLEKVTANPEHERRQMMQRILRYLAYRGVGETKSRIKRETGVKDDSAITSLMGAGLLEDCQVEKNNRHYAGFRLSAKVRVPLDCDRARKIVCEVGEEKS